VHLLQRRLLRPRIGVHVHREVDRNGHHLRVRAIETSSASWSYTVTGVCGGTPDFALSASPPSQNRHSGRNRQLHGDVAPSGWLLQRVALTVSAGLPTGATYVFNPTLTTASSILTVTTSSTTPAGSYPLTISGTGGGLIRSYVGATLTVARPGHPHMATNLIRDGQ